MSSVENVVTDLVARIPRDADEGAILESFLSWATSTGLTLYEAQEEALLEIVSGANLILNTPTGSGKSLVAVGAHYDALCRGERSFYTSPIKALVSEKFFSLCDVFGAQNVGMLTGDASINARAPIICCTAEVLANMALRQGTDAPVDVVIMDEFHYYGDRDRGAAWQIPLLVLSRARFVLMSATLGDTTTIETNLVQLTGRRVALVRNATRPVPLEFTYSESAMLEKLAELVEKGKAPVYVVNFSQAEAAELAQGLTSSNFSTATEKTRIGEIIGHFRFDSPYGKKVGRYVRHGVGLHHAGLLPKYRLLVERLAQQGALKVICGTDTLGVGVNVPIRCVLFTKLYKYDGEKRRILSVRDFKQIAGRAGRKGFDNVGYVVCQAPEHVIENKRRDAKAAQAGKKGKFERMQPEKGFVPYDHETYQKLIDGQPEPLTSTFSIDHGMMLNLLQRPADLAGHRGGYGALMRLIAASHEPVAQQRRHRRTAKKLFGALVDGGLVNTRRRPHGPGRTVELAAELGDDFSVFQTLALFLLDALPLIDMDAEDHALQILTLVESIIENPTPVLIAQERQKKGERLAELKAAGVDYEDRVNELEKVTYPKPMAEFLYEVFNDFADRHPWIGRSNVAPKSVARDMLERWLTFNDYIVELDLERVEGVLLRYLTQVYKTLVQTVPAAYRSDAVMDAIGYLRAMLERVDSSLLQEWEKLLEPGDDPAAAEAPRRDLWRDPRAFNARIRSEVHILVKALAERRFDEAAAAVRNVDDAWKAEDFEASLEGYFARWDRVVFDHRARLADKTSLRGVGDAQWELRQILVDPDDECEWAIEARIDLRSDRAPEGPLIEMVRITGA